MLTANYTNLLKKLTRLKMIQINDKVNKTQLFKELTEIGKRRFEFTCEPDEDLKVFLDGAEQLFKLLRIASVVNPFFCNNCNSERYRLLSPITYQCKDCDSLQAK